MKTTTIIKTAIVWAVATAAAWYFPCLLVEELLQD